MNPLRRSCEKHRHARPTAFKLQPHSLTQDGTPRHGSETLYFVPASTFLDLSGLDLSLRFQRSMVEVRCCVVPLPSDAMSSLRGAVVPVQSICLLYVIRVKVLSAVPTVNKKKKIQLFRDDQTLTLDGSAPQGVNIKYGLSRSRNTLISLV